MKGLTVLAVTVQGLRKISQCPETDPTRGGKTLWMGMVSRCDVMWSLILKDHTLMTWFKVLFYHSSYCVGSFSGHCEISRSPAYSSSCHCIDCVWCRAACGISRWWACMWTPQRRTASWARTSSSAAPKHQLAGQKIPQLLATRIIIGSVV